ncbi:MAG: TlpA family protein disulfide reductase [Rhizobacter sp.]
MKPSRHVAAALAVLAIGVGAYLTFQTGGRREPAPDITYTLLDGSTSGTAQLRGKVVLMNFWATTCSVCLHEMPQIVATHEKYRGRGLETVAVAMSYDPPANVIRYAQSRRLPFGVAIDNTGVVARRFGNVNATPTTVLIDKRGVIVERYTGEPDFAALQRLIDKLLAEA